MANLLTRRPSPTFNKGLEPFSAARNLLTFDPFRDWATFDPFSLMRGTLAETKQDWLPALEVKETPTTFEFKADVPGIKEEDLDVSLSGNRLTLSGKRDAETREDTDTFHTYERSFGSFTRTFMLPDEVDADKVKAELKDGVLWVTVPKIPEARAKKIEISGK